MEDGKSRNSQADGQADQNLKLSRNCNTFRYGNVLQFQIANSAFLFYKPAERLWNERGGAMERMKFSPEGGNGMSDICSDDGAVKVSTGMGKRDKRAAAPDRHKTGNFIN